MQKAPTPNNEDQRLDAVKSYGLLDTKESSEFDSLTSLAAELSSCPISLITLLDEERNWFKAHYGTELREDARDRSFCGHAIDNPEKPLIIENTLEDKRFFDNPLVTGETNIRFYAGFPIVTEGGFPLGTLCIMDQKPNKLSDLQIKQLKTLSLQALFLMEHWKKERQLAYLNSDLIDINKNLNQLANIISKDLDSPLNLIQSNAEDLLKLHESQLEEDERNKLHEIRNSGESIQYLLEGFIQHNRINDLLKVDKKNIEVASLMKEVCQLVNPNNYHQINFDTEFKIIRSRESALKRILLNLLGNSIRHSNKKKAEIQVDVISKPREFRFEIRDNGPGVHPLFLEAAFEIYNHGEKLNPESVGIGLATVKKLVEGMDGKISLQNREPEGLTVNFTLPT